MSEPKRTVIMHGAYGRGTTFDIVQHRYGGTDCESDRQGYAEVLEIRDAPEGKYGFVIHVFWNHEGSTVHEFDSLESAMSAFKMGSRWFTTHIMREAKGYLCTTSLGPEDPWFYNSPATSKK